MKNKHSFLYGSFILILSVVITKVIGAIFRIPLANLLGGVGMGYYSAAYGVFMPVYAVTAAGLPSAVAKIVSENAANGRYKNLLKIKRVSTAAFTALGLVFTLISIPAAFLFCKVSDNGGALLAVLCILPAVLFGSISCVLRGYYEGLRNMHPTAISQVLEAVFKLALGLCLTLLILKMPPMEYLHYFGDLPRLSAAAAAAICGVTISSVCSVIFLIIRGFGSKDIPNEKTEFDTEPVQTAKEILVPLFLTALPIALGALVTNLTTLIDITTTIPSLKAAIASSIEPFLPVMHMGVKKEELAPFIFGSFTGLAVTVFTLIPSFTNMFAKSALPLISESVAKKDREATASNTESVIFTAAAVAVPGGLGISLLAGDILRFLFPARLAEADVSTAPLSVLGIAVIFLCLSAALFSVLQAAGRADIPLKIMAIGVAVKLILNLVLVRIPTIGITGAAIGTLVCYAVIFVLTLVKTMKQTGADRVIIFHSLFAIAVSSALCGITAESVKDFLHIENETLHLFIAIAAGGVVYIAAMFLSQRKQLMGLLKSL
ncbi:MAG: polysaccharide biosynthesis C-terminal domain-containing protein [Ruminococcus sp.]|jgi:stage V sporulation protein B|nr:polysaccharide biosynthesis C-terminal domain-containing protein [Ruminococcus sp.]